MHFFLSHPQPWLSLAVPGCPWSQLQRSTAQLGLSRTTQTAVHCSRLPFHKPAHSVCAPDRSSGRLSRALAVGLTARDYCSKRASGPRQETYCSSILFINNKALRSQDVEEKCPQHFPFEMQSAGDQNIKYSIHFNSLTTEVRDQQTQWLALGRHPW